MKPCLLPVALFSLLFSSGCQLANEVKGVQERNGQGAFSCQQIQAAFAAYDADRESLEAYYELARVTGLGTSGISTQTADEYYARAKERANIALILQGCPPL